jgi:enamine deaminase RidA (YjgF/YER057c/UK114 family)
VAIERHESGPRMSQAVVHDGTVYLAGQISKNPDGVQAQTREILARIDELLAQAGTDKSKVLTATVWLTDISTWSQMNEVWDAWVDRDNPPARAAIEAALAGPEYKVEIMVVAAR